MSNSELTGAKKALLAEYRKAIDQLITVIAPVGNNQLCAVVDESTTNPDCKSIQAILTHVVSAGFSYSVYIENYIGLNTARPPRQIFNSVAHYIDHLNSMFGYCEDVFNKNAGLPLEQTDHSKKINVAWGQQYDVEQLLEHAIVHILRHRRQIENFIKVQSESLASS